MLKLSKRAAATAPSPIRKFLPLILAAEKRGVKIFKLNVGDPEIMPAVIFWQTIKDFPAGNLKYAPSPGFEPHVAAWLSYYRRLNIKLKPEQLIPTVGAAEAILYALMAVADAGDEVLVFEPFYPSYKSFATMLGIKLRAVTLKSENQYSLPPTEKISQKISQKTKALVVINPNNPTGTIFTPQEMARLISIAKKYRLFIIADETYRDIIFRGKAQSILKLAGAKNCAIVVDSASKRFSLPGARIGCLVSYQPAVMEGVLKFCMARLSAPTLEQFALIPLLQNPLPYLKKIKAAYFRRCQTVIKELKKIPGISFCPPAGAFYISVKLPVAKAEDFIIFLLKKFRYQGQTVALTPLSGFYQTPGQGQSEVRIACVLSPQQLKTALKILGLGLAAYNKKRP